MPGEVTQDRPSASSPVPARPSAIAADDPAERPAVEVDLPVTARDLEHAHVTTSQ
jgi:hypothetical protein